MNVDKELTNEERMAIFIQEKFPNRNYRILEIGSGWLCPYSNKLFKAGYKSVTAIDPTILSVVNSILTTDGRTFNTIQKNFDEKTDITNFDILTYIHACGCSELVINQCKIYNKGFAIVPCEMTMFAKFNSREEWIASLVAMDEGIELFEFETYDPGQMCTYKELLYKKT